MLMQANLDIIRATHIMVTTICCYECKHVFDTLDVFRDHCKLHIADIMRELDSFYVENDEDHDIPSTAHLLQTSYDTLHVITKGVILAYAGAANPATTGVLKECIVKHNHCPDHIFCINPDLVTDRVDKLKNTCNEAFVRLGCELQHAMDLSQSCWELNTVAACMLHCDNDGSFDKVVEQSVYNHYYHCI